MQGESDRQRELLDVESVAGHLLEPGSVFALLAEHREMIEQSWPVGDDGPGAPDGGHADTGPGVEPPPSN